jgi:hypothetical protein
VLCASVACFPQYPVSAEHTANTPCIGLGPSKALLQHFWGAMAHQDSRLPAVSRLALNNQCPLPQFHPTCSPGCSKSSQVRTFLGLPFRTTSATVVSHTAHSKTAASATPAQTQRNGRAHVQHSQYRQPPI